ncbi:hypothetical protein K504DRAFT_503952 [Pleomassaria siparia CBS 279.74]|uniref:Uncharacterized protein n=1 Tax=Pleomassaria siparia CBS 279.74 TaxID=1314801 RepID=A0A6G1K5S8_9PLEO|nr:hypothetical protein K504DRAFT_503952 [Pleomassaria siparia CBS 279.74]
MGRLDGDGEERRERHLSALKKKKKKKKKKTKRKDYKKRRSDDKGNEGQAVWVDDRGSRVEGGRGVQWLCSSISTAITMAITIAPGFS